jgi:hypothetical protein
MCIFYSYIWKILCINAYIFKGLLGYKNPVHTHDVYVAGNTSLCNNTKAWKQKTKIKKLIASVVKEANVRGEKWSYG